MVIKKMMKKLSFCLLFCFLFTTAWSLTEISWTDKASPTICFEIPGGAGVKKVILTITTSVNHASETFTVKQPGIVNPVAITAGTPVNSNNKTLTLTATNSTVYEFSIEDTLGTVASDENWKLIITGFTVPNTVTVSLACQDASYEAITPSPATLFSEYGYTWLNKTSVPVYFHITGNATDATVYTHTIIVSIDTNQTVVLPLFQLFDSSGNNRTVNIDDNYDWTWNTNKNIQFPSQGTLRNFKLYLRYKPLTAPRGYWLTDDDWTLVISGLPGTTKTDVLISTTNRLNAVVEPDPVKLNRPPSALITSPAGTEPVYYTYIPATGHAVIADLSASAIDPDNAWAASNPYQWFRSDSPGSAFSTDLTASGNFNPGTYTLTFTATDDKTQAESDTVSIKVNNPPAAGIADATGAERFSVNGDEYYFQYTNPASGSSVSFDGVKGDDEGDACTYLWQRKTTGEFAAFPSQSTAENPSNIDFTPGIWTVRFTVTETASGRAAFKEITLYVVPPPPSQPDLAAADDSGSLNTDNITKNTANLTFSGTTISGASITITLNSTLSGLPLGTVSTSDGSWSMDVSLIEGNHSITATATDGNGSVSSASTELSVTVDATNPAAPGSLDLAAEDDSGASDTDNITKTTSGLSISGSAGVETLVITLSSSLTGERGKVTTSAGTWSIEAALAEGEHSLTATATDTAGNTSAASAGFIVRVDTTAPAGPAALDLAAPDDSGVSDTDNITKNTAGLTITGSAEANSTVSLSSNISGVLGSAVSAAGTWSVDVGLSAVAHSLTATATDSAGNTSTASTALAVTIDTEAPSGPGAPDLASADDTGISNADNITKQTSGLSFSGTAPVENNTTITLSSNVTGILGTVTTSAGTWSLDTVLSAVTHSITATATDAAGNISAASSALSVAIDTGAPSAPGLPDLAAADDTGSLSTDNITKNTSGLSFSGTVTAENSLTITLNSNATGILGTVTTSNASWSLNAVLTAVTHSITATATDVAGNTSAASPALSVMVDVTAPAAPGIPDLAAADDTGSLDADNNTKNTADLTFSGSVPAENSLSITLNSSLTGSCGNVTTSIATWSLDAALSEGTHSITATATDIAGNISNDSPALSVRIDTTSPAVPGIPDLASADDTGYSSTDNITSTTANLSFTCLAESSVHIDIYDRTILKAGGNTDAAGSWVIDLNLTTGSRRIYTIATDAAGNLSTPSPELMLTIDTSAKPPALLKPLQGRNTGRNLKPTFLWTPITDAYRYSLQVDNDSNFNSPEINLASILTNTYTPGFNLPVNAIVPRGTRYFIRIKVRDRAGNESQWSNINYKSYINVGRFDSDVNGDGFSDVIVGAYGANRNSGLVYVYYGGRRMDNEPDIILRGNARNTMFGISVACAGDVNSDGFSDVIVGSPGLNNLGGAAYIFLGGSPMDNNSDIIAAPVISDTSFGTSVASAGDVNADGCTDVIVGIPKKSKALIYYGGTPMNAMQDVVLSGKDNTLFGQSVACAGDVNGDRFSDIITGAPGFNSNRGQAFIFLGDLAMNNQFDATVDGEAMGNMYGCSVSSADDINKDGYSDVIVGAFNVAASKGKVYIYLGGPKLDTNPDAKIDGPVGSRFGFSVASAGDMNNDTYSDVVIGAPRIDGFRGCAMVYTGRSRPNYEVAIHPEGEARNDSFGFCVSCPGDVNGDGYSDIVVGAPGFNNNRGKVYIYMGRSAIDADADIQITGPLVLNANPNFGASVNRGW